MADSKISTLAEKGDILQVIPTADNEWSGCFMVVCEVYSTGFQGYVSIPGEDGGEAYIKVKRSEVVNTGGKAPYVMGEEFVGMGTPIIVPDDSSNDR